LLCHFHLICTILSTHARNLMHASTLSMTPGAAPAAAHAWPPACFGCCSWCTAVLP
jgi:hypothetical protein